MAAMPSRAMDIPTSTGEKFFAGQMSIQTRRKSLFRRLSFFQLSAPTAG
jgi:hypothetical protein